MKKLLVFLILLLFIPISIVAEDENGSLLDEIKERGVLKVGTSPDFAPNEFIDPSKTGQDQYVGSDIELAKYIAEEMGVELEIVASSFDTVLANISTGQIDLAIAGLAYTPARAEAMEMSIGYNINEDSESAGQGLLIRKSDEDIYKTFEDLKGATVAAQTGSIQWEYTEAQLPDCTIQSISSIDDGILLLKNGTVDAIAMAGGAGGQYETNNEDLCMMEEYFEINSNYLGSRVGAPKGEVELIEEVNRILTIVNEEGLYEVWYDEAIELNNSISNVSSSSSMLGVIYEIIVDFWPQLLNGILITLGLALITVLFGTLIGGVVAFLKLLNNKIVQAIMGFYVEIIRGTPLLLQLWLFITLFSSFTGGNMPMSVSVIIALIINSSAYVAEIIRSGIQSVDKGQTEAARSLGMTSGHTMLKIVLPQAIKNILPALGNEFVMMIKETSLASTFFIGELMTVNTVIKSATYRSIEPLIIVGLIYFILTSVLSKCIKLMEGRLSVSD